MNKPQLLPEFESRRHIIDPYNSYGEIPPDKIAAWKAPFGPAEKWDLSITDKLIPGLHGDIPIRIYEPRVAAPSVEEAGTAVSTPRGTTKKRANRPALVWIHGGAFLWGDLDMPEADATARGIAGRANAVVVSVDYRLCTVPEVLGGGPKRLTAAGDPVIAPVPTDECVAAYLWTVENSADLGIDPSRVAIGGASAGGCLAAAATLSLMERGRKPWQVFPIYALFHENFPAPSPELIAAVAILPRPLGIPMSDPGAETPKTNPINDAYLGGLPATTAAYPGIASAAELAGFPPTFFEHDELDGLRASGELFAQQLRGAGVPVTEEYCYGAPHGHLDWVGLPAAAQTMDKIAARLTSSVGCAAVGGRLG